MSRKAKAAGPNFKTVPNVPVVSTGTYALAGNPYPGGETTFTDEDLADAVAAVEDPSVALPRLKLGHMSDWGDAEPAFGKLDNLRISDNGQTIYADYVGVPAWLAEVLPTAYPSRSIEARFNVKTPTGREYRMVISALALLGVVLPGVATLEDLAGVYTAAMPEGTAIEEDDTVVANVGGDMKLGLRRSKREASAAVNAEDVRRSYYDALGGDQFMWWIRAMYIGQGDDHLIVDDDDGTLYRVPFTINGEEVEFGEATEVKIQYADAGADSRSDGKAKVLEASAAATVFASRSESRPEETNQEDSMELAEFKKMLGLSEDASDEEVRSKIEGITPPSTQEPGQSQGDPANQGPESAQPSGSEEEAAENTPAPAPEQTPAPAAAGTVTTDNETIAELRRMAQAGADAAKRQEREDREKLVEDAIKAGKFPPSRRDHWIALAERDPEGTKEVIASLEAGLIPVDEQGSAPSEQEAVAAYPEEWLSPAERARAAGQKVGAPGQIIQEA